MPYRDEGPALEATRARLKDELAQVEEQIAAHRARQGRPLRVLPLLEDVRIATPCSASWDDMAGTERVRRCRQCDKNVFNLSAMTHDEALALLAEAEAGHRRDACVRLYRRADGTVLTSDCPVGAKAHQGRRRRRLLAGALGVSALAVAASGLAMTCHMGAVAPPPPSKVPTFGLGPAR